VPAADLKNVTAELTSGARVALVDVSQGGARFMTTTRMLPGLGVTLKFVTAAGSSVVRGQIVRSALVNMNGGTPGYEVGVAFDAVLSGPIADATAAGERAGHEQASQAADPDTAVDVVVEVSKLIDNLSD